MTTIKSHSPTFTPGTEKQRKECSRERARERESERERESRPSETDRKKQTSRKRDQKTDGQRYEQTRFRQKQ